MPGAVYTLTLPSSSSTTTTNQLQVQRFRLVAPHHKSERFRNRPIEYQLPEELCILLDFHLKHGLRLVMRSASDNFDSAYGSLAHVFVMGSTRKPLVKQQPSQVWRRVVLPEAYSFGPQVARSGFATGIRNQELPRPEFSAAAAAEAMGHNLNMWDTTYDRLFTQQAVQTSVDRMASWRQQVLQQHAQQQQQAAAAAAAADEAVDNEGDDVTAAAVEEAAVGYESDSEVYHSFSEPESSVRN